MKRRHYTIALLATKYILIIAALFLTSCIRSLSSESEIHSSSDQSVLSTPIENSISTHTTQITGTIGLEPLDMQAIARSMTTTLPTETLTKTTTEVLTPTTSVPTNTTVPVEVAEPLLPPSTPTQAIPDEKPALPQALDATYAQAMRTEFVSDIADYQYLIPRYHLRISIYPNQRYLEGIATIIVPNRTSTELDNIVLRLYPNFPQDAFGKGGNTTMDVTNVTIDGSPVVKSSIAQSTAVMLPFNEPLQPNAWATIEVAFTATFVAWEDGNFPLPSYYPMLAVYDEAHAAWRTDVTTFVDRVFAESAFYAAEITAPSSLKVLASGTTIDQVMHENGTTTHSVRTGPMREFAIVVGDFEMVEQQGGEQGDIAVKVYKVTGSDLDTSQVAYVAATALTRYDYRFGKYPFNELEAYVLRGGYRGGWEYPGMFLLSCVTHIDAGRRYVTAHEVAHQWWYNVVGSDIYRHPWLDEALAQYSGIIYAEEVAEPGVADSDWEREVLARYYPALDAGDLPIGWSIIDYPNFDIYFLTVYGKGAVFLKTLRNDLGDAAFFAALQEYYRTNRYGIAKPQDIQQAFEHASGRNLQPVFANWVYGQ